MAEESLYDLILRLKRETNKITLNPVLDAIDLTMIERFSASEDSNYKKKLKIIKEALKDANVIFTPKYKSAFDAYNELAVFEYLNQKIPVKFIPEKKDQRTPDYQLLPEDSDTIFSDLKTLHYFDGNINYDDVQEQAAVSSIKLDNDIKKRDQAVIFSEPVTISPFRKGNNTRHYNIKNVIEDLIKKCSGLVKLEQVNFQSTHGILLFDTIHLTMPPILEIGLPVHEGSLYKELNSGILWNVAFGEIGDPTYNWIEFEGKPNIGEKLAINGLLKEESFKELKAVAFIINSHQEGRKIIGFHRANERSLPAIQALRKICDFMNDDVNSYYWKLRK